MVVTVRLVVVGKSQSLDYGDKFWESLEFLTERERSKKYSLDSFFMVEIIGLADECGQVLAKFLDEFPANKGWKIPHLSSDKRCFVASPDTDPILRDIKEKKLSPTTAAVHYLNLLQKCGMEVSAQVVLDRWPMWTLQPSSTRRGFSTKKSKNPGCFEFFRNFLGF